MVVYIQLYIAGSGTCPFDIYSSEDLINPLHTDVTKEQLLIGYYCTDVPEDATFVRVKSKGEYCTNYIDLSILIRPTTTTSTSTTSTTSTSTTTTTTTTANPIQNCYLLRECETSNYYSAANPNDNFEIGDVAQFRIGGVGRVYCGEVIQTNLIAIPNATIYSNTPRACSDEIHCNFIP